MVSHSLCTFARIVGNPGKGRIMIELNLIEAMQLSKEIVDDFGPDFTYRNSDIEDWTPGDPCHYVHGGEDYDEPLTPGCIVGHVFYRLGIPLEDMNTKSMDGAFASRAASWLGIKLGQQTELFLNRLQVKQDQGAPWGECLQNAIASHDLRISDGD